MDKTAYKQANRSSIFGILCLVFSSSLFSILSLYSRNVSMIPVRYALPFMAGFAALGWLAFGFSWLILRSGSKAALLAAWLMAIFCNFGLLTNVIPGMIVSRKLYLLCGLACVALSVVVWWLLWRGKSETIQVLLTTFALVFTMLALFNLAICIVTGIRDARANADRMRTPDEDAIVQAAQAATLPDRPNVYFMLFDEYAGFDELAEYYNFDNSPFYDALTDLGFTTARGCTNEMIDTMYVLADLTNLQFLHPVGYQEDVLRHQVKNGVWFDVMETLGYTIYETETYDLVDRKNPVPGLHVTGVPGTQTGDTYIRVFLSNTAAYLFSDNVERLLLRDPTPLPDAVNSIMTYYADSAVPREPSFFFSYVCSPHGAFYFDADGNRIDTPDDPYGNFNWTDKSVYLGQLQYVNTLIEKACAAIIARDPDSIIIVCSDHGARNHTEYGNADVTLEQSLDVLMAVYDRGQPMDGLDTMNGVNILRRLLTETYGMELPQLNFWPDGHLVATSGRLALAEEAAN